MCFSLRFILPFRFFFVLLQAEEERKENMSTAEMRAHSIYNMMHLSNIDDEVKRHLVILLMKVPEKKEKFRFDG